jgi:type I restriction enzyme, S subunit
MRKRVALGDALDELVDHRGKTPKKLGGDWTHTGHRVLSALNIKGNRVDDNDHHYVNDELYVKWMKVRLCAGDVLLTSEAPLGEVAFLDRDVDWCLGQRLFGLRGKPGLLDGRYLSYALRGGSVRDDLMARSTGSTVAGIRQAELVKVELDLPPITEQRGIAATLGALDDRIESNHRTIDKVLDLARALYQQALTVGIREVAVGDAAEFHNRRRIPLSSREREARPGDIPYYGATGIFGYVDEFLFNEILVLVGEDGSVVRDDSGPVIQYIWGMAWINNHAHPLTGQGISNELLYLALDRSDIRPLVTGAVQPKISMGSLKSLVLELPAEAAQAGLEARLASLFALLRGRTDEVRHLERLRDALLPELLAGRIRVPEAAEEIGAAA